jgi:protein TorT
MIRSTILMLLFWMLAGDCAMAAETWYPVPVDVWTPPFNTERKTERQRYAPIERLSHRWTLCASIPHLNDTYWLAVDYGLIAEARRLDIRLSVSDAGGYDNLDRQRDQIVRCMDEPADALIVASVSSDGIDDLVDRYAAQGKPVIDLIEGVTSRSVTARAAADYFDLATAIGEYLKRLPRDPAAPVKIGWFPGPAGVDWSKQADKGLRSSLAGSGIEIVAVGWGDTGLVEQEQLVADAIGDHPDLSFIVGTGVSAQAAVHEIRRLGKDGQIKVLSYYYTPAVNRAILRGNVLASATDEPALQARLAIDLALRALEKRLVMRHIAAPVLVLDASSLEGADLSDILAPEGFRAILSVGR